MKGERVDACWSSAPLLKAAEENDSNALEQLLQWSGDQIDVQDATKRTGLIVAASKGYLQIVTLLLKAGASVNICDENQSTCLHHAVEGNFADIVSIVVEQPGVDIFATNRKGESPLSIAFHHKRKEIMETMLQVQMGRISKLEYGGLLPSVSSRMQASKEKSIREYHGQLLKLAIGFVRRSPALLEDDMFLSLTKSLKDSLNIAVNKHPFNEVTILHSAAFCGSSEEVELLLQCPQISKSINDFDGDGQTALHYATMEGRLDAVKILAANEYIRPNVVDRFDRTALQVAMERNFRYISFTLLAYQDVQVDQDNLYKKKDSLINAANAILVGGALIASVTFAAVMQPPLGYDDPFVRMDTKPMSAFWICNGLAFFTALTTVLCATRTVVSEQTLYIREEVKMLRTRLRLTAIIFFISSELLFIAYSLATIVAVAPKDRIISISVQIVGSILYSGSVMLIIWFSLGKMASETPSLDWQNQELLVNGYGECVKNWLRTAGSMFWRVLSVKGVLGTER